MQVVNMKIVKLEWMVVNCDKCGCAMKTKDLSDFKDSGTYPPSAMFMCVVCNQLATVVAADMPRRLFSHLVHKVVEERFPGLDQSTFNNLRSI